MAFETHFLTFVLVLKVVKYSGVSRGKKRKEEKEGKEITKISVFKQLQKHQLPPMTIMRCFIHLGDMLGCKAQAPDSPSVTAPPKEEHICLRPQKQLLTCTVVNTKP